MSFAISRAEAIQNNEKNFGMTGLGYYSSMIAYS